MHQRTNLVDLSHTYLIIQQKQELLPEDWKSVNVTAIHKKGSKQEPGKYRPMSYLCNLQDHGEISLGEINHTLGNEQPDR